MLTVSVSATAVPVQLQNGTATFSQGPFGGGPYNPQMAIDGIFYTGTMCCSNGWTIERFPGDFAANETAVWQTVSDVGPSFFTFTMYFLDPNPGHLLGRFRWSVTTDDRSTYADGLSVSGNIAANWTVLTNPVMQIPTGMTSSVLTDGSVLLEGPHPGQGLYQVRYLAELPGVTGIRLEVLKDPSLPAGGPGFYLNGNFVLTELQLDTTLVPEPATHVLMFCGIALVIAMARRHRADHSRRNEW
jgi:hypothetical protein